MRKKLCVLTGAGISAESGLKTFREAGGLWEGHKVEEVASPSGWDRNKEKVLDFYNQRRRQLKQASPNPAHSALVALENYFEVKIITQNVDDLHERAGSSDIIHLHGELNKVRSTLDPSLVYTRKDDLLIGDTCEKGSQLRPHIVWFGEMVPALETAITEVATTEVLVIIGTSMQVYPAASLVAYVPSNTEIFYVDPKPHISYELRSSKNLTVIPKIASLGVVELVEQLIKKASI